MNNPGIKSNLVYTANETKDFLRVSNSTIKRLLKKGILRANKIGGQYRILGKEILKLISPKTERKAISVYQKIKIKAKGKINKW